jgi:hypothetical protein
MNKKASEKINAGIFLLCLLIIGAGVTILLSSYVNAPVDVRSTESGILYNTLLDCFVENGFVKEEVLDVNFDIYSSCHINESLIVKSNLYFEFNFVDSEGKNIRESIVGGNSAERKSVRKDCEVNYGTKTTNSNVCLFKNESYFYVNDSVKSVKIVGWTASFNLGVRDA